MSFPIGPVLRELGAEDVPEGPGWRRMRCPFHQPDRTASAAVNHELNAFKCLACEVSGDAIKLLREQLHLSFREAKAKAEYLTGETHSRREAKPRKPRRASDLLKGANG